MVGRVVRSTELVHLNFGHDCVGIEHGVRRERDRGNDNGGEEDLYNVLQRTAHRMVRSARGARHVRLGNTYNHATHYF